MKNKPHYAIYLIATSLLVAFASQILQAGPPGSDGTSQQDSLDWSSDSTSGFPDKSPLSATGSWDKMSAVGGPPSYTWVWKDQQNPSADISLRKIPPQEGETVEEIAQFYARTGDAEGRAKISQVKLSEHAIIIEKISPKHEPSFFLKIFQHGPDIWMLSGSGYEDAGPSWKWVQGHITNFSPHK